MNSPSGSLIIPKQNGGWKRKEPIQLNSMALRVLMEVISTMNVGSQSEEAWKHKCKNFKQELPREIFCDLVQYSKKAFLKPLHLTSILEAAPSSVYISDIDFVGNYHGAHSCTSDNNHVWLRGVATDSLVDLEVLKRLVALLDAEDKTKLKKISLWTKKDVISPSNFPRIIAKSGKMLTSLTLRGDTDDHILRIIGLNCEVLQFLDVSRSSKVTAQGLQNLFFKRNKTTMSLKGAEKNKISESLISFTITITLDEAKLSKEILFKFGRTIFTNYSYFIEPKVPDYTILVENDLSKIAMTLYECFEGTDGKLLRDIESLVPFDPENPDSVGIDIIQSNNTEYLLRMFDNETRLLHKIIKIELELGIIELTEYWDNRMWDVLDLIEIADLAVKAPNIKKLCCRLIGSWDESWGVLFPNLEEVNCWCLFDDSTQAILKYCPALRIVDVRHVPETNGENLLTDLQLTEILETNVSMKNTIEEFNIRPTKLTKSSILEIYHQCPKIRRIGDLEVWNVQNSDIEEINQMLYKANSQCVLVVLDFPPRQSYQ